MYIVWNVWTGITKRVYANILETYVVNVNDVDVESKSSIDDDVK